MFIKTLVILALALGLAFAIHENNGSVIFFALGYRIETSWNFFLLVQFILLLLTYYLSRAVTILRNVRHNLKLEGRTQHKLSSLQALAQALRSLFDDHLDNAIKQAAKAARDPEIAPTAQLLAANAAHRMEKYQERDRFLAEDFPHSTRVAVQMAHAAFALDEGRNNDALAALKNVPHGSHAVRLEIKANQRLGRWQRVLELLPHIQYPASQAHYRTLAHRHLLSTCNNLEAIKQQWAAIPVELRSDTGIATTAATRFITHGDYAQAHDILLSALDKNGPLPFILKQYTRLLTTYPAGLDKAKQLAEDWLNQAPNNPALLLFQSYVAVGQNRFDEAQTMISKAEASGNLGIQREVALALTNLYLKQGKPAEAMRHYQKVLVLE